MSTLAPLIRKLTGGSALADLRAHLAKVKTRFAKHRASLPADLDQMREQRAALITAWVAKPTGDGAARVVDHEARMDASTRAHGTLYAALRDAEKEAREAGRDLVVAAIVEVSDGLERQRAEIIEEDRRRSEEMGVDIVSDAVLSEIERKIDGLARGRQVAHIDFDAALSALRTVVPDEE